MCELAKVILEYPKLSRGDLAVLAAIEILGPDAYRTDIARLARVSPKKASEAVVRLNRAGVLQTTRIHDHEAEKTRNSHLVTSPMGDITNWLHCPPAEADNAGKPGNNGAKLPIGDSMHDVCMMKNKEEINKLLNFIDQGERERRMRQRHVTVEYAAAWREWWDRAEFGQYTNPAGFANAEIKRRHDPPAPQIPLPGGAIEPPTIQVNPELVEAVRPSWLPPEATLGADGKWR